VSFSDAILEWPNAVGRECLRSGIAVAMPVSVAFSSFDPNAVLDSVERSQAERFLKHEDAKRYCAAHGLMRLLLGAVTGRNPSRLHFSRSPCGKPFIPEVGPFDFNLSHGGSWVAAALSRSGHIGVDVEARRPQHFWEKIATSFLAPLELEDASVIGHLKMWTAKEAIPKAHGTGFAIPPGSVTVTAEGARFRAQITTSHYSGVWRQLGDGDVLAIAGDGLVPHVVVCRNADRFTNILAELSGSFSDACVTLMKSCHAILTST